ncbi:MAG: hypothetical protein WA530_01730 [Candidatus Acidiferrum sp.]
MEKTVAAINRADAIGVAAAIVAGAVVVIWIFYGLKHVFTYPLADSRMDIRILGVTIRHVPISDIDRVEVIPFAALVPFSRSFRWDAFFSWKWCGYNKRVVAIKRRTGLVKRIIVSPGDPEAFANSLKVASSGIGPGG